MVLTNHVATTADRWRFEYDYRPDGYPKKVIVCRKGEIERTIGFGYNQ